MLDVLVSVPLDLDELKGGKVIAAIFGKRHILSEILVFIAKCAIMSFLESTYLNFSMSSSSLKPHSLWKQEFRDTRAAALFTSLRGKARVMVGATEFKGTTWQLAERKRSCET